MPLFSSCTGLKIAAGLTPPPSSLPPPCPVPSSALRGGAAENLRGSSCSGHCDHQPVLQDPNASAVRSRQASKDCNSNGTLSKNRSALGPPGTIQALSFNANWWKSGCSSLISMSCSRSVQRSDTPHGPQIETLISSHLLCISGCEWTHHTGSSMLIHGFHTCIQGFI